MAGAPSPAGGLILCHDDAGWTPACHRLADRLARMGYYVVAPALFDRADPGLKQGYGAAERVVTRALARVLPVEAVGMDVDAAGAALAQPALGLLGLGWGATMVWRLAARSTRYSAAVCYYGAGIDAVRHEAPRCPTQVHIGDFDEEIMGQHVGYLHRDRPEVHVKMYEMARHDFLIEESENYEPLATTASIDNAQMFLRAHMAAKEAAAAAPVAAPALTLGRISRVPALEPAAEAVPLRQPMWQPPRAVFGRRASA
jgi:carboxymethylenebutenolidase